MASSNTIFQKIQLIQFHRGWNMNQAESARTLHEQIAWSLLINFQRAEWYCMPWNSTYTAILHHPIQMWYVRFLQVILKLPKNFSPDNSSFDTIDHWPHATWFYLASSLTPSLLLLVGPKAPSWNHSPPIYLLRNYGVSTWLGPIRTKCPGLLWVMRLPEGILTIHLLLEYWID